MKKRLSAILVLCLLFTTGCQSTGGSGLPIKLPDSIKEIRLPWDPEPTVEKQDSECKNSGMALDRVLAAGACGGATYWILEKMDAGDVQKWLATASVSSACWILLNNYQNQLCEERQKLKGQEKDLDARLAYAQGVNEKTKEYNRHIIEEIDNVENEINTAKGDKDELKKINKKLNTLEEKIEQDKTELVVHLDELKQYRKTIVVKKETKVKLAHLDSEIERLEMELAVMEKEMEQVASCKKRTRV